MANKTLLRKIKEDLKKWKHSSCSWIGRLNIKTAILAKLIYKFNTTPIQTPTFFLF